MILRFNSPDGMISDSTGLLWIQTDGEDRRNGEGRGTRFLCEGPAGMASFVPRRARSGSPRICHCRPY
ncbi:MAG: DUF839 domain-containing protein [Mesorhizobium sp.]|nr:MAG: DUF839 domain-containing protein [Mesorhizobium sp.]